MADAIAVAESVALLGMDGHAVEVEVAAVPGLPTFTVVGLPDTAVQEARERVRAAIQSTTGAFPQQRITVNLSPAHLPKAGSAFDLAIALGLLAVSGNLRLEALRSVCLFGELSLDGGLRGVRGTLCAAVAAARSGKGSLMVAQSVAAEAALVSGIRILPAEDLSEAVAVLEGRREPRPVPAGGQGPPGEGPGGEDMADVRGQAIPRRALEVTAAGGHNLLLAGSPGGGKTMLARRLPGILPPLSEEEAFEVTRIYSVAGLLPEGIPVLRRRPFRAPHQSISVAGMVGGGSGLPVPGEASLAHRGVLFLDECGEFRRDAIQALRGPIEDGRLTIVRSRWAATYPSAFQLVAATNPCPCGWLGDPVRACECLPGQIAAYRDRLSGPILDRIDLSVNVDRVRRAELLEGAGGEPSAAVRARVERARAIQEERLRPWGAGCNARIPAGKLEEACPLSAPARARIGRAVDLLGLSARGAHRTIRVARTIADLAGAGGVDEEHIEEALMYRVAETAR